MRLSVSGDYGNL